MLDGFGSRKFPKAKRIVRRSLASVEGRSYPVDTNDYCLAELRRGQGVGALLSEVDTENWLDRRRSGTVSSSVSAERVALIRDQDSIILSLERNQLN